MRGVKIDLDCQDIVKGARYDGMDCGCDRSGRDIEMNLLDGDEGPGCHVM